MPRVLPKSPQREKFIRINLVNSKKRRTFAVDFLKSTAKMGFVSAKNTHFFAFGVYYYRGK